MVMHNKYEGCHAVISPGGWVTLVVMHKKYEGRYAVISLCG